MIPSRNLFPFLMVAVLAVIVSACGSDEASTSRDGGGSTEQATSPDPGSPEAAAERTGGASFALTPEVSACLDTAGFATEPTPATHSIMSWRHDGGARVAIAPNERATEDLAEELGTTAAPATVDGTRVSSGPAALTAAAAACLDA